MLLARLLASGQRHCQSPQSGPGSNLADFFLIKSKYNYKEQHYIEQARSKKFSYEFCDFSTKKKTGQQLAATGSVNLTTC